MRMMMIKNRRKLTVCRRGETLNGVLLQFRVFLSHFCTFPSLALNNEQSRKQTCPLFSTYDSSKTNNSF